MADLVSDSTRARIQAWHPQAHTALAAAEVRAREALDAWGVELVGPLSGGAMSVVCLGRLAGASVVVKAPLDPQDAAPEATALAWFAVSGAMPALRRSEGGVLLMDFLEGDTVPADFGPAVAAALASLHEPGQHGRDLPPDAPAWETRRPLLFDEYALRLNERAPDFGDVVAEATDLLPALLEGPRTLLHGDLQGKNLLSSQGRTRVLDPLATSGPLGWEFAHAACSVVAAGGSAEVVLRAGLDAGLAPVDIAMWLLPAAVHHAGVSSNVGDPGIRERLRTLLSAHPTT